MEIPELRYFNTSKNENGKWAWKGKFACFNKVKKIRCFNIKEKGKRAWSQNEYSSTSVIISIL